MKELLVSFIITLSIRLFYVDYQGAQFYTRANGKLMIKNTRLQLCFKVQKHRAERVELGY